MKRVWRADRSLKTANPIARHFKIAPRNRQSFINSVGKMLLKERDNRLSRRRMFMTMRMRMASADANSVCVQSLINGVSKPFISV